MTAVITSLLTSSTTSPVIVNGYETRRQAQNRVHDLISGGIAVALIQPRPRAGTLRLVYETEADAFAAFTLHTEETVFTLAVDDVTSVSMSYVTDGDMSLALDEETQTVWVLSVGYQEVET